MKGCLAKGYPFVFGLKLYPSFHELKNGYVKIPDRREIIAAERGYVEVSKSGKKVVMKHSRYDLL